MNQQDEVCLSVILPSFNDPRIFAAIASVMRFDDIGCTTLLIIDGGSKPELVAEIKKSVRAQDRVISEKDKGIFDGLNKGLAMVSTEFLGWLGSDDFFAPDLRASELVRDLKKTDILVANTAHFSAHTITRITYSWPVRWGLQKCGLNNPHFSTFGRSDYFKRAQFNLQSPVADIEYFLEVFAMQPRIVTTDRITTYMAEGGFSNGSLKTFIRNTRWCWGLYWRFGGAGAAISSVPLRLIYKLGTRAMHACLAVLRPRRSRIPVIPV
jgi:glycosyltransferase involved in cell wall biosynthesis